MVWDLPTIVRMNKINMTPAEEAKKKKEEEAKKAEEKEETED